MSQTHDGMIDTDTEAVDLDLRISRIVEAAMARALPAALGAPALQPGSPAPALHSGQLNTPRLFSQGRRCSFNVWSIARLELSGSRCATKERWRPLQAGHSYLVPDRLMGGPVVANEPGRMIDMTRGRSRWDVL